MQENKNIVVRELSPELLDDYMNFFENVAFVDNPKWASCYCYFPHAPHATEKWPRRTGVQNRAAVSEMIQTGRMHGYLAYENGSVIGWCNAGPRVTMTILDDEEDAETVGAVICFIVAKEHRGKGVARRLLDSACEGFRRAGLTVAEGYPRDDAHDEATNHFGPMSMYMAADFEKHKESGATTIMRKKL